MFSVAPALQLDDLRMEANAKASESMSQLDASEARCRELAENMAVMERQLKFLSSSDDADVFNENSRLLRNAGLIEACAPRVKGKALAGMLLVFSAYDAVSSCIPHSAEDSASMLQQCTCPCHARLCSSLL